MIAAELLFPTSEIMLPSRLVRILGYAFSDAGDDLVVEISIGGKQLPALWGLPSFAAWQKAGCEPAYLSGFTQVIDLGNDWRQRPHIIEVSIASPTEIIDLPPLTFKATLERSAKVDGWAAGSHLNLIEFSREFLGLLKSAGLRQDSSVVEIGPGAGRCSMLVAPYLEQAGSFRGFDVDPTAVEFCTRNITSRYSRAIFEHIDVANGVYNPGGSSSVTSGLMPLPESSVDMVYAWSVFTHLVELDFRMYFYELSRILKASGVAVLSVFIHDDSGLKTFSPISNGFWTTKPERPEAAIAVEFDVLNNCAEAAGLRVEHIHARHGGNAIGGQDIVILRRV